MNREERRVSVVLAARNAAADLPALLGALPGLGLDLAELCACDDASSDATAEVLQAYSRTLPVKLARNGRRQGPAAARNRALALASCPLALFVDADTRPEPGAGARLLRRLEKEGCAVAEGIYSPRALDPGPFSDFYALFSHHSFLQAGETRGYNVFNAWLALCRREALAAEGGHPALPAGVEAENETLGRRLAARGRCIFLEPAAASDHRWGGARKLLFIYTSRVYWWVKTWFSAGRGFEAAQTTSGYAAGTLALPAAALLAALPGVHAAAAAAAGAAVFLYAYRPFLLFALRRRGPLFAAWSLFLCAALCFPAAAAAAWSAAGELARLAAGRGHTVPPEAYR